MFLSSVSCVSYYVPGVLTLAELANQDIEEYDIILGINSLTSYYAILYCFIKTITVAMLKDRKLELEGTFKHNPIRIMFVIHA